MDAPASQTSPNPKWPLVTEVLVQGQKAKITVPLLISALFYDLTPDKTVTISSQSERRERDLAGTDELALSYAQGDRTRTGTLSKNHRAMIPAQFTIPTVFVIWKIGLFSALKDRDQRLPGLMCFPPSS